MGRIRRGVDQLIRRALKECGIKAKVKNGTLFTANTTP